MSLAAGPAHSALHALPRGLTLGEPARLAVLWLMMVGGAFVFAEPSPYEMAALAALGLFALTGAIRIAGAHIPLIVLLLLYCFGLTTASLQVMRESKVVIWVLVSWYLAVTTVFFAAIFSQNTEARLNALMRGWSFAAMIAATAGMLGYFRVLPGAFDLFTLYGRAKGTFNDPNVFGPFLILPMLIAIQTIIFGRSAAALRASLLFTFLAVALLLSFSRGAWIHFILSLGLMLVLMFATAATNALRLRLVVMVGAGLVVLVAFVAALLSIDKVAELMQQRASLSQSYDSGPMGRFGRHAYGWQMVLDLPLGLGPYQFSKLFVEAPHNVYLNAFITGGWLGGIAYGVLVAMTLWVGFFACLKQAPWQKITIAAFATFAGVAFEGKIIDTDHWRHFFALAGLVWGLALANRFAWNNTRLAA